jgi:YesN/AraC family two-component response regulator
VRPLKILIVDDEYWVCENVKSLLGSLGPGLVVLDPAHNGEDALARAESEKPDLVISDIDMPFMTGNQFIKELKRAYPQTLAVVLSGYSDFSYVREALLDGAIDYLLKPVSPESLDAVLQKARDRLEGSWAEDQTAASWLEDGALTALLQEPGQTAALGEFPALSLPYPQFTLLLVQIGELPKTWNHQVDPRVFALRVKTLLARELSGEGAQATFQNQLCRNEFLVLTDREETDAIAVRLGDHLARLLGAPVDLAISLPFYALPQVREAYQQTKSALFTRTVDGSGPIRYADVKSRPFQSRVSPEQEKRLAHAVSSQDVAEIQRLIFEDVGLRQADGWLLAEIHQTVVYVAGFLVQRAQIPAARISVVQEAFDEQLSSALRRRSLKEVCALLEGWIDELFGRLPSPKAASVSMRQIVKRVAEYIEDHYFDELSLATLAETFRVDSSYLSKAYKQVTGTNLMAAIARRRIEKAKEYIRDRRLPLVEVASLVGYEEYAYFNRVFHKVEGISPTEYRERMGRSA